MLTGTATTAMLRTSIKLRTCALQPTSLLRAAAAAAAAAATSTISASSTPGTAGSACTSSYSTLPSTKTAFSVRARLSSTTPTTCPLTAANPTTTTPTTLLLQFRRHASTDATRDANAAAARDASRAIAADPTSPALDWNTFFQLRKTRRRWQVAFSVVMSLATGTGAAVLLSTGVADPITSTVPLDPVMTLGLVTLGFIALGWLLGPSLGNALFYLVKSKYKVPMTVKEGQFFARIKKNRVDPSNDSTGNPVPDFYGEKISSVAGYRQWLKDQRAYNKKRTTFIS
ncbi:unnamed protein product [Discula destructiva]